MGFEKGQIIEVNEFDYRLFVEKGYAKDVKPLKTRKTKELK